MMILNFHVGPIRSKMTNIQKMNIYEMNVNECSMEKSESKRVHISVYMSKVKYAMDETNYE